MTVIYTLKLAVPLPERRITTNMDIHVTTLGAAQQLRHFADAQGWEVVLSTRSKTCETLDEAKAVIGQRMKDCGERWIRLPRRVP